MATSRYDLRKTYEEAEANAIGTEYVRLDFLPPARAEDARGLMRAYLDQCIAFYTVDDPNRLQQIDADTAELQAKLWSVARRLVAEKPTPVSTLLASGMNDVLNSQSYTQAAWWNRIPRTAWMLMLAIAMCANLLVGYGSHEAKGRYRILLVMPLLASIAFMLIADLDSPRGGLIHVVPQNLTSLSESLKPH